MQLLVVTFSAWTVVAFVVPIVGMWILFVIIRQAWKMQSMRQTLSLRPRLVAQEFNAYWSKQIEFLSSRTLPIAIDAVHLVAEEAEVDPESIRAEDRLDWLLPNIVPGLVNSSIDALETFLLECQSQQTAEDIGVSVNDHIVHGSQSIETVGEFVNLAVSHYREIPETTDK